MQNLQKSRGKSMGFIWIYSMYHDVLYCSIFFWIFFGCPSANAMKMLGHQALSAWLPKTRPLLTAIGPEAAEVDSDVIAGDTVIY